MAEDRFGDIKIVPDFPEDAQEAADHLSPHPDGDENPQSAPGEVHPAAAEEKSPVRRPQKRVNYTIPLPSRRAVAWLSLIPLLAILYGVGSYFLIPSLLNNILLPSLSRHADRPVEAGRIVFSPFTLALLVEDVTVGPVHGDPSGNELLALENARLQFSLRRILDGKPVFVKAVLDGVAVNVVRRQKDISAELRMVADLFLSPSAEQKTLSWPAWLFLDEMKIDGGTIHIDDRLTEKVFTVEDIHFYLPSAATRENDETALPALRAVIDSSPFEVTAVRFRNQSGAWRTGFSFEFEKLIISNYKELFPFPATGLRLSEGEVDIHLKIILPEDQLGPEVIVVEGEANLRGARWEDPDAQSVLALPEARIMYHIVPSDKLVRLSSVEFQGPGLTLAGKKKNAGREPLASIAYLESVLEKISRAEEALDVENFLWNNGKVVLVRGGPGDGKIELHDVTLVMNGFTTAGYRRTHPDTADAAHYTFRAKDISTQKATDFISEGQFAFAGGLQGTLAINGLDPARYPSLLPKSPFSLVKGTTDISFHYEYAGPPAAGEGATANRNKVYNGAIKTAGYALNRKGNKAAAGETLDCKGFSFDLPSKTIVCDQLAVGGSDIFTDILFGREDGHEKAGGENWQFRINNLSMRESAVHTLLRETAPGEKVTLILQDVTIEGKNLQAEKVGENIKASARAGKQGKLTVGGSYSRRSGQGNMQVDIRQMELSLLRPYFSSWFIPKVTAGLLSATGSLQFPDREFKGSLQVDGLAAGEGSGARIQWKQALASAFTYRSDPLFFAMDEVVVQQPSLDPGLSSGEKPVAKYLRLTDKALPQSARVGRIRIEDGTISLSEPIIYPGYQPVLKNITGTLSPDKGSSREFALNGNINDQGSFTLLGTGSLNTMFSYMLDVRDFPLHQFDAVLRKEVGVGGLQSATSWREEMAREDNFSTVRTEIAVRDMIPEAAGSAAPVLSLLVNENHLLTLEMEGRYSADKPRPFLLEQLINRLRHLQVKAAISPLLVLKNTLPALNLPESVVFAPGSSDLPGSVPLSGYRELLRTRPFTSLILQGQYDPVVDGDILRAQLQQEADRLREIENKRRAMEKIKILQEEKRRLKELKEGGTGVITEEIVSGDPAEDLEPLPPVTVQVDPASLEELAGQRARILRDYLVNQLQLDPERVRLESKVIQGVSGVGIRIQPYLPAGGDGKNSAS
jgi:hypothetical protein